MPRAGAGDEGSGPQRTGSSGFGGWLGGAARAMTGGGVGSGYVVLGGTRYGLRISQVTRAPLVTLRFGARSLAAKGDTAMKFLPS